MTPAHAAGNIWSWSLSGFLAFTWLSLTTNATPINRQVGISENVFITVQNDTYGIEQRVCSIDSMTYGDGETIPTSSPCEHCICRPPGFACTIISCEYRPGCKAFKRSNQCCPEYQCECEKDGKIYQNGEKIQDSNNPCEICYCQGGEIVCAVLDCYWRSDCQPRYIESRCCPLYDHCPPPTNVGPFMRPTHSTTVAPSFPWFNLSSAVYEVPHRTSPSPTAATFATSPTPVPVFLTSRPTSTEKTSSSSTFTTQSPPAPELVVMATEKAPIQINIMATSQEHGDDGEITSNVAVVPHPPSSTSSPAVSDVTSFVPEQGDNGFEKGADISSTQESSSSSNIGLELEGISSSNNIISDNSTATESPEQEKIVPSTPILLMPPPVDSTTLFFAPAIAISILPSPVEQILVTQQASLLSSPQPEVVNQIIGSEQSNYTAAAVAGEEIAPTVEVSHGESSTSHHEEEIVVPTPTSVDPTLVQVEVDNPTTQSPVIEAIESEQIKIMDEPELGVTSTANPSSPLVLIPDESSEKVEFTTTVGGLTFTEEYSHSQQQQQQQQVETESIVADAPEVGFTTISSIPNNYNNNNNLVVQSHEIPSIVLTPPDKESGIVEEEVVTVTSDIPAPSVEMQTPTVEFDSGSHHPTNDDDHQGEEKEIFHTTVSSVHQVTEEIISGTTSFAPDHHRDEEEEEKDKVAIPVGQEVEAVTTAPNGSYPTNTETLQIAVGQGSIGALETDELPQNTETEIVTEAEIVSVQEFTTEHPVSDTSSLPPYNDEPLVAIYDPQHIVTPQVTTDEKEPATFKPIIATTTVTLEKEMIQQDDAVHISAATEDEFAEIAHDSAVHTVPEVVVEKAPPPSIPHVHPSTNEVNSINVDTFEIIPPQENDAENVIEIQSQLMDGHNISPSVPVETVANNEVDTNQNDRYSDDDTIEIFAANYNANNADPDSKVKEAEATTTQQSPAKFVEQAVTLTADAPEIDLQDDQSITVVAAKPEEMIQHYDDETGESDDDHEEVMHPDDQHGSSDSAATTENPVDVEAITPSSVIAAEDEETGPLNDEQASDHPFTTQLPSELKNLADSLDISHDEHERTTISSVLPSDDEEQQNDDSVAAATTTTSSVAVVVKKVVQSAQKSNNEESAPSESKFRLDLSAFDHSGEIGSHEAEVGVTIPHTTVTPSEVVFDEGVTTYATQHHHQQRQDSDIGSRDETRDDEFITEATTISPASDAQKLSRDGVEDVITTTQKHGDEVEPIQNFELDEVSPQEATTNRPEVRSELKDEGNSVAATTINPTSHDEITTFITPTRSKSEYQLPLVVETANDFVEVSTSFPSGFGSRDREEVQDQQFQATLSPLSSFKSDDEIVLHDGEAETTPVFVEEDVKVDDEGVEVTTFSSIHHNADKAKSELVNDDIVTTTVESRLNDDGEEGFGGLTNVSQNATTADTSTPRIISIDTMMIPETGVSIPSVSDDIGRSDTSPREGENDSWFVQTATKNRQLQGLFPSSRSQKRLFSSRTPRDTSNTYFRHYWT